MILVKINLDLSVGKIIMDEHNKQVGPPLFWSLQANIFIIEPLVTKFGTHQLHTMKKQNQSAHLSIFIIFRILLR